MSRAQTKSQAEMDQELDECMEAYKASAQKLRVARADFEQAIADLDKAKSGLRMSENEVSVSRKRLLDLMGHVE